MSTIARSALSPEPFIQGSQGIRVSIVAEKPDVHIAVRTFLEADHEIATINEYRSLEAAATHAQEPAFMFVHHECGPAGLASLKHKDFFPGSVVVLLLEDMLRESSRLSSEAVFDAVRFPLEAEEFLDVVRQAKRAYRQQLTTGMGTMLKVPPSTSRTEQSSFPDRIVIRSPGRFVFLSAGEIDWLEAKGNYVRIYAGDQCFNQRQTMKAIESRLDPRRFLRIHRSVIVNIEKIRELRPWPTGEYVVVMRNGKELTLSRGYRQELPVLLGNVI